MFPAKKHPVYHLRLFGLSLSIIVLALVGVLFGVHMEAIAHAAGTIQVRDLVELRAELPGLAELGWYEGEVLCSDKFVRVRLDRQGAGMSDPAQGVSQRIENFRCREGSSMLTLEQLRFHKLESGDKLWPGQVAGHLRADDLLGHWQRFVTPPTVLAPAGGDAWQVLKVFCGQGQAVKPGDLLAWLAPIEPATNQPRSWIARLEIPEKHASGIEPGQEVRLFSVMYNQRLHGHAHGTIEKVEPLAEPAANGERHFLAQVRIVSAPFPLHHGASVKGEIVLGHKRVYRIILEQ
jgi:hypothetical protein